MSLPKYAPLLILLVICLYQSRPCKALSTPLSKSSYESINSSAISKLSQLQCALQISVGRIPGTAMPKEWAASGARLAFSLEIEFTDELCSDYEMTKESLLQQATKNPRLVVPLNEPSFVSTKGQEKIVVKEGAFGCQLQTPQAQQYALRFFLDFPNGAQRNDVTLPSERIYFLWSCWIMNEASIDMAEGLKARLEERIAELGQQLEDFQSKNVLEKAMGMRQNVLLVEKKGKMQAQLAEVINTYPLASNPMELATGPNGLIFPKEGVIAVKRWGGSLGTREQYHWVGTFTLKEFFEDAEEEEGDEEKSAEIGNTQ
ncbi:unnamed protein product [Cylindrotheca closterium]|uniref:Uncharacterized protein n=1 Tax=Cylindrotheca closterium TaxID=2856 RepID=A0AAD2PXW3_9STRA|nr:unnamed protein product [Cylindrotheca closterium]